MPNSVSALPPSNNAPWTTQPLRDVVHQAPAAPRGVHVHLAQSQPTSGSSPFSACSNAASSLIERPRAAESLLSRTAQPADPSRLSPSQRNLLSPAARRAYDDARAFCTTLISSNFPQGVSPADIARQTSSLFTGIRSAHFPPALQNSREALLDKLAQAHSHYCAAFI